MGNSLREGLSQAMTAVATVAGHDVLLENHPNTKQSFALRRPYLLTLHAVQGEVMARLKGGTSTATAASSSSSEAAADEAAARRTLTDAMTVTVQGIAAGMQNTG